jgi:hypothetical protein
VRGREEVARAFGKKKNKKIIEDVKGADELNC